MRPVFISTYIRSIDRDQPVASLSMSVTSLDFPRGFSSCSRHGSPHANGVYRVKVMLLCIRALYTVRREQGRLTAVDRKSINGGSLKANTKQGKAV
jgi:hypothetical protein